MKQVNTCECKIYCGLKEGYDGEIHDIEEVYDLLQEYCDKEGFAVTVTPTRFIYTKGNEPGVIVGLIIYPRFPKSIHKLAQHAITIGNMMLHELKQERLSIVGTDYTTMLEKDDYPVNGAIK